MGISYEKLKKKPRIFVRVSGVRLEEFQKIYNRVKGEWERQVENKKKSAAGRKSPVKGLAGKLLAVMMVYRN